MCQWCYSSITTSLTHYGNYRTVVPFNLLTQNIIILIIDIDECVQEMAGCDQNCTNTAGSYYCTCMDGYELESDSHTCTGNHCIYNTLVTCWIPQSSICYMENF